MAAKPGLLWNLLTQKCPHCRKGSMFTDPNPWHLKNMLKMPARCPECGQLFELEVGFWYGTAYVSYAITVLFSGLSFVFWLLTIGFSLAESDHRIIWWLVINGVLMIILQPWFMRLSRAIYLYIFVPYNEDYKNSTPKTFDYKSEDYFLRKDPPKA